MEEGAKNRIGRSTKRRWFNGEFDKKLVGKYHPNWKGGKIKVGKYVYVYAPNHPYAKGEGKGYVMKHRLIMEKKLGRYLKPTEIVHHIDEKTSNDNIKNLKLIESNSAHMSLHRLGKPLSQKTKKKLSERFSGKGNPFYHKKHTTKTKKKISQANMGKSPWNKELTGKDYLKHYKNGHFVFGRKIK